MLHLQLFSKSSSNYRKQRRKTLIFPFVYAVHFRAVCVVSITVWITFNSRTLILYPEGVHTYTNLNFARGCLAVKVVRVEAEEAISCKVHREEGGKEDEEAQV